MATRDILTYPDPRLRKLSEPVRVFDDDLRQLVRDMTETMYAASGIGLAAIQVGVAKRVIVMDISRERNDLRVFINPEVIDLEEGQVEFEEGCLSVPGVNATVARSAKVIIRAQDVSGARFERKADELLAVCIQHEVDHLNGKVIVDYLSSVKRDRIRKKLKKELLAVENQAA